jgi:hypothetical protein
MLKLQTDFNALSDSDQAWGLWLDGQRFEPIADSVGAKIGDRVVILEPEDFEVEGDLGFGLVDPPCRSDIEMWFVKVDWATLRRF